MIAIALKKARKWIARQQTKKTMIEKGNSIQDIYERILLIWGYIFFSPIIFIHWLVKHSEKTRKIFTKVYGLFNYYKER